MENKNNKILIILGIIGVILLVTSVSYAIWQVTLTQPDKNTVTTSCFKIEFQDANPINLEKSYPILDEEGKKLIPYEFTIKNTCDTYASYQINLEILNDSTLEELSFIKIMLDEDISLLTNNESVTKTLNDAHSSYKLKIGHLDALEEKTFNLRLWMDEDTPTSSEYMNKVLLSKIVVVTSYETDFDRDKPIASISVTKEDNKIIVDASKSSDNTRILNYYYSKDGKNFIKTNESSYTFIDENIKYGNGVESLTLLEKNTANEVFVRVEDEYGNMSELVSEIVGDMLYDETIDNNLRYVGATPNNYVDFNGEKWRIIGVMNNILDASGEKDARIKLIRDESIGEFASDVSASNVNAGWGVNEWSQTKLKTLLNEYYYNNQAYTYKCAINGIDQSLVRSCTFNGDGLKDEYKKYLEEVVWNTGANEIPLNDNDLLGTYDINTFKFYEYERSTNSGKNCSSGIYCTDTVERKSTWTGKIGLIYPSDFGFASINPSLACQQESILKFYTAPEDSCTINNWLKKNHYWTITPAKKEESNVSMFSVSEFGYVTRRMQGFKSNVYPVVFLKPDTKIISGDGTIENSYQLSIE